MVAVSRTEGDVTRAFVGLAGGLARGVDVLDLLDQLTGESARLLDVASAGLLLADSRGVLHVLAASSERTRELEVFQLQREEGPCLDSYRSGEPISVPDLDQAADRWPQFVPHARRAGFASVHALPMRLRQLRLGTLGLFGTTTGSLNEPDLGLGQALADVASVALVQDRAAVDRDAVNEQLQTALTSRVAIEQAKGILAEQSGLDMPDAFRVLRRYARDHNMGLTAVAQLLVSRQLRGGEVFAHVRQRARTPND